MNTIYNKVDNLINSDKYKPLKLYRRDMSIYTSKYKEEHNDYNTPPEDSTAYVCSFTEIRFEFGLIDYTITYNDNYNYDEELESTETTFHNEFISKKDMKLFLEFEFDLLNILVDSKPKIVKDLTVLKLDFDTDIETNEKYAVYYKDELFLQYYLDNYNNQHDWYFSLLACADIHWKDWEDYPTFSNNYYDDDDTWLDDDYYDYDEQLDVGVTEYKSFKLSTAKDIVYTLLEVIDKVD